MPTFTYTFLSEQRFCKNRQVLVLNFIHTSYEYELPVITIYGLWVLT